MRNGVSNELKDSLQYTNIPDNLNDFNKLYSKRDSLLRARAAAKKDQQWDRGFKKPDNANSTTSIPEMAPAGTVSNYHGPAPMDLSAVKGKKITLRKGNVKEKEDCVCIVEIQGILWRHAQGS